MANQSTKMHFLTVALLLAIAGCTDSSPAGNSTSSKGSNPGSSQEKGSPAKPMQVEAGSSTAKNSGWNEPGFDPQGGETDWSKPKSSPSGLSAAPANRLLPEWTNIHGKDDRVPMTSEQYPWSAIGRIKVGNSACTGTLVGEDLVLTNAHCVIDDTFKTLTREKVWFERNYKNGSAKDKAIATEFWLGTDDPSQFGSQDWAILRIDKPLGAKYGYMGWRTLDFSNPSTMADWFVLAGYSGDFQRGKTAGIHSGCSITRQVAGGFLLHDCDTTRGSSGSGIFAFWPNSGAQIIALNSAELRYGEKSRHLDKYSDRYANIAVMVSAFAPKLEELRDGAKGFDPGKHNSPGLGSFSLYENSNQKIKIKYPQAWRLEELNRKNSIIKLTEIVSFAPPRRAEAPFTEVTITAEEFSEPLTLDEYREVAAKEVKKFSGYNVTTKDKITLGGQPAYKIYYSRDDGDKRLKVVQAFAVRGSNRAYVITYTAELDKHDSFLKEVEAMIDSFQFL
ncbi:MAG: trypsin-like serine protease [Oscillatoria sp. SIO1A7]|nr:trypsin-like serine protease [Oscillatoria sp. SIO1A7]